MFGVWQKNIVQNREIVQQNGGPALVTIVSGSETDQAFWQQHLTENCRDVFRADGTTRVNSVCEGVRKGNFLGTFNAWLDTRKMMGNAALPDVALMSMVFGKGKRFSPFTQAMGNRKPAFVTPMRAPQTGTYLRTVDLSNLYSNLWIQHLGQNGFRGLVVKWGDEAIIPGKLWSEETVDFRQVDAVRFVWKTDVTETLAREKEWIAIDPQTGIMRFQYARQNFEALKNRLDNLEGDTQVGVNLGSLALSYDFLAVALEVLQDDIADPHKWVDWDPYAWIALFCPTEEQWQAEIAHEERIGNRGIQKVLAIYPDFYQKMSQVRRALEAKTGRPLTVSVIDFGQAFWLDLGLHLSLQRNVELLVAASPEGTMCRELFGIPHTRDEHGNTLVNSQLPAGADVRDSVIVDTVVQDKTTVIHGGVVVGGRHQKLSMPQGGSALFCAVDTLAFTGPRGIAYRLVGDDIIVPEGGRYTTLFHAAGPEMMASNESIVDYNGANYTEPISGNRLSFEAAGKLMAQIDGRYLDQQWRMAWENKLS